MDLKVKSFTTRVGQKVEQYKSVFQDGGIAGLTDAIGEELDQWKNEQINIAVAGETGSGKSTFINALRGLHADSPGAAPVGSTTTTTALKSYAHPNNTNCFLWDLPGIGADGFSQDTYLTTINSARYDFFVIVSGNRFTQNDIFLARAIENIGKFFFFVRTKFGDDLENESAKKKGKGTLPEEHELKGVVKRNCQSNLADFKSLNNIFIIDSYMKNRFDFHHLSERLVDSFKNISDKKQVALTLTLFAMTKQAIGEKKSALEDRISRTALKAAIAPRLFRSDTKVLLEEIEFYREQFGLDKEGRRRDEDVSRIWIQMKNIMSDLKLREKSSVAETEFNDAIEICIPFITGFFNIYKTYTAGKVWLKQSLDYLAEHAIDINRHMVQEVASNNVSYASCSKTGAAK